MLAMRVKFMNINAFTSAYYIAWEGYSRLKNLL
jgi:hypothetical protein